MSSRRILIPPGFAPDGVDSEVLSIEIKLVKARRQVLGATAENLVVGATTISLDGQGAEVRLPVNAEIRPAGTQYQITLATSTKRHRYFATIPSGSGDLTLADVLWGAP